MIIIMIMIIIIIIIIIIITGPGMLNVKGVLYTLFPVQTV